MLVNVDNLIAFDDKKSKVVEIPQILITSSKADGHKFKGLHVANFFLSNFAKLKTRPLSMV